MAEGEGSREGGARRGRARGGESPRRPSAAVRPCCGEAIAPREGGGIGSRGSSEESIVEGFSTAERRRKGAGREWCCSGADRAAAAAEAAAASAAASAAAAARSAAEAAGRRYEEGAPLWTAVRRTEQTSQGQRRLLVVVSQPPPGRGGGGGGKGGVARGRLAAARKILRLRDHVMYRVLALAALAVCGIAFAQHLLPSPGDSSSMSVRPVLLSSGPQLEMYLPESLVWAAGPPVVPGAGEDPDDGAPASSDLVLLPYQAWHLEMANELLPAAARMSTGRADELMERLMQGGAKSSRCAVVGNARSLLTDNYGREIDKHDLVVRFNQAPTRDFERHVGSRTDIRFLHDPRAFWGDDGVQPMPDDRSDNELVVVRLYPNVRRNDFGRKLAAVQRAADEGIPLLTAGFELEHSAYRLLWGGYEYGAIPPYSKVSTGMLGIVASLSLCGQVTMYGFNPADYRDASGMWSKLIKPLRRMPSLRGGRYFDRKGQVYRSPHDFTREQVVLARLIEGMPNRLVAKGGLQGNLPKDE